MPHRILPQPLDFTFVLPFSITRLLLVILIGSSSVVNAQTDKARFDMSKSIDQSKLITLRKQFETNHKKDEAAIKQHLKKNPKTKRTFVKNGSVYYLQRIDADGNPVYINTKNKASGELIKANQFYSGGSLGVNITGTGMIVGVWDGGQVRATHELLSGRVAMQAEQTLDGSSNNFTGNNHQTHVTGTIVGKDIANQPSARGIAHNATAKNYDFSNDLPEMTSFAGQGYLVSNHSYGAANDTTVAVWRFGAYDSEARDWDNLTKNVPTYLPFVAGGNEQQSNGNSSKAGYDLMTGSSAAKNSVTVGAINGDKTMSNYSNWGPTDDGRVKPDIVAKGTGINSSNFANKTTNMPSDTSYSGTENSSGTSYATPAVTGVALLLQQYHNSLYGSYIKASTLKALLLTTAEDLGQSGPDAKFGWGLVNAEKSALAMKNKNSFAKIEEITTNPINNSTDELLRTVTASGCEPLMVAIAWTDDAGPEQTSTNGIDPITGRLVYDFDVMVKQIGPNTEFRPWKPISMLNRTSDATICSGWFDVNNNNYKQIRIANPVAGASYEIYIRKKLSSPAAERMISLIVTGIQLPPTGIAAQTFLPGATIANLVATGSDIKWYDAATGGNLLANTTILTNSTIYYASQNVSGCESSARLAITVSINGSAPAAPTGMVTQTFCTGATVSNLVVMGSNIKWYDAATGGNLLVSTTTLTNSTIYYATQTVSGEESANRLAVTVNLANGGPMQLVITQPITSGTIVHVANNIEATNQISGANVEYRATQSIILNPGFVATGNVFKALIGGCN